MREDAKKTEQQPSNSRLTVAAVFAFLPNFGILGVHNFIVKQYLKGLLHIAILISAFIAPIMANIACPNDSSACLGWKQPSVFFVYITLLASYIWAIIEGVKFLQSRRPPDASSAQWAIPTRNQDSQTASSKRNVKMGETAYFEASPLNPETKEEIAKSKKENSRAWSILSFIFAIIPLFIWAHCLITTNGNYNENGSGAVFWLLVIYYGSIGIPFCIMSIAFGFAGLKTDLRGLAIASLSIKIITIFSILCLFLGFLVR